jgi:FkbM family methyltransferase
MFFNFSGLIDKFIIKKNRLRRLLASALERNRDLDAVVAGALMRINSRREYGYLRASRIVRHNATLRDEMPSLMNLFAVIRDGDTFVDIGANAGLYTHSISRLCSLYPNLKIVSVEPNPSTFARLSFRGRDEIEFMNYAISDIYGELEFVDGAVSHVFAAVDKRNSYHLPGQTTTVTARRLDDLFQSCHSLVLKIDVEGQERNVLDGASRLLSNGSIRVVYLDGYEDQSINDLLLSHGFALFEGRTLVPNPGRVFSLLAIKQS